jgi:hypothetical protein
MSIFDDASDRPNNSADSFIGENLSIYQVEWLRSQSEALGQTRTEILDKVLEEWFAIHAPPVWDDMEKGEIARWAVGEFIFRHHEEFLPVSPSNK